MSFAQHQVIDISVSFGFNVMKDKIIELPGGECGTFSPKIMEAFIRCRKKMEAIVN